PTLTILVAGDVYYQPSNKDLSELLDMWDSSLKNIFAVYTKYNSFMYFSCKEQAERFIELEKGVNPLLLKTRVYTAYHEEGDLVLIKPLSSTLYTELDDCHLKTMIINKLPVGEKSTLLYT